MGLLHRDCAHWSHHQSVSGRRFHFICSTIKPFQSFAPHLQLHLGILFEDLRVGLAKHLSYPLVGYASCAQSCGIRGAQVVNPKVGNLCSPKSFSPNALNASTASELRGTSAIPFGVFEFGIQTTTFCRSTWSFLRGQFLVDSQPSLGDDSNHVPQILRSVGFDALLFRPRDVVRSKQSFHGNREFDT